MVSTIGSMAQKSTRSRVVVSLWHLFGGVLGGLVVGLALGSVGLAVRRIAHVDEPLSSSLVVFVVALALVHDVAGVPRGMGASRQTPQAWAYVLPNGASAFLYGADLGFGLTTRIYFASYFAVMATVFVTGEPLTGMVVGTLFGFCRALSVVVMGALPRGGHLLFDDLLQRRTWIKTLNGFTLALMLVVTATSY